jgi:cation diffusion facilitator family transporter
MVSAHPPTTCGSRSEEASYDNVGVAFAVLVISMALAAAPLVALLRNPTRGPAAKAQMWELVNDQLGLVAALAGTSLAIAGFDRADPIAAVVIATIISWKAISLLRENLSLLIGRAPDRDVLDTIERIALGTPGVVGLHDLRAELLGPDAIHLGMHIDVAPGTAIEDADGIAKAVRIAIHDTLPGAYCVIHVDPATSTPFATSA